MQIFAGLLRRGGVKRQWGCRRRRFEKFSGAICSETFDRISRIYTFQRSPKGMTLNDPEWLFHGITVVTLSEWNNSCVAYCWSWVGGGRGFPVYITTRAWVCSVSAWIKCSSTCAFSYLSLRVQFITTITLTVNNDDGSNREWSRVVRLCIMRPDWLF